MSRPSVNILFNVSANDTPCTNPAGDSNFVLLGAGDSIVWRDSQQNGGDSLSGVAYPTIIPESGESEAPKMFLMDFSESEYQQIIMAGTTAGDGGGNFRYVCAAWFSGDTLTVPYLEAYDDDTHETWASKPLGDGTPANSVFKAIDTTAAVPGSNTWAGTPLAGTDSRVALNDGDPIAGAGYIYWNIKEILSDGMLVWDTVNWYNTDLVFAIHFTYA
jgi:hypothetical protein